MRKFLTLDLQEVRNELLTKDFVRSSEILGPTEDLFPNEGMVIVVSRFDFPPCDELRGWPALHLQDGKARTWSASR